MPKLTVLIICKDEQLHIRDCIESARLVADEILVADSGSTDNTLDIVADMGGCRVIEREFIDFANFRNWALPQCRHQWVLVLDADERVTPELAGEIKQVLIDEPSHDAYALRRNNYFLGHPICYSGWGRTKAVRLLRRDACRYSQPVHEAVEAASGKIGTLRHRLDHFTAFDVEQFVAKQNLYSSLSASHARSRGKRASLATTLLHAPLRFLQLYLLRGGFLDGFPGLMVCGITSYYTFLKDIKLWGLENGKGVHREKAITLRQAA